MLLLLLLLFLGGFFKIGFLCITLVPVLDVPELARSYSHTDEYLAYNHRTLIWQWMEIQTETHIGALD